MDAVVWNSLFVEPTINPEITQIKYFKISACDKVFWLYIVPKINKVNIKKQLSKIRYDKLNKIFNLKLIYNTFFNNKNEVEILKECINNLDEIKNNKECYTIKDLQIDGKILINLGYKGKEIGKILEFLLDEVIKNPLLNHKDILINLLKL